MGASYMLPRCRPAAAATALVRAPAGRPATSRALAAASGPAAPGAGTLLLSAAHPQLRSALAARFDHRAYGPPNMTRRVI